MSEQLSDGEPNLAEIRRAAVRYWERRRIVYNVLLAPPSIVSYSLGAMSRGGGSDSLFTTPHALLLFAMAALGANVCYSFVYALEFWFGNRDPESLWNVGGRPIILLCGIILGIVLAHKGGLEIAFMQYGAPNAG
jgi:hypothetical protein